MEVPKKVKFLNQQGDDFLSAVRQKVDGYFKEKGIPRTATCTHHLKVLGLLACWILVYAMILGQVFSPWPLLLLAMLLGVLTGILGINISHDSAHGSYSANHKINKLLAFSYDLIGFSSYVWRLSHNGGHHTFTNIAGHDPDIDKPYLLRLTPQSPWYPIHAYQNWYIWILYSLVSLNWVYFSDYLFLFKDIKRVPAHELALFFVFKVVNALIFIALPMMYMTLPWWQVLIGYIGLQMAGGFTVALIFQLAHIVECVQFPKIDESGVIHNQWGVHELLTTANFATNNLFLSHLVGGLNFQVEHHLFPLVAHSHYWEISPIVRQTAHEFNLPYNENKTFTGAIASHWRLLKKLGRRNCPE